MRCRSCHYSLKGLTEHRCPECGREFDPNDPNTFEYSGSFRFTSAFLRQLAYVWAVLCILILAYGVISNPILLLDSVLLGSMFFAALGTLLFFPLVYLVSEARADRLRQKLDKDDEQ